VSAAHFSFLADSGWVKRRWVQVLSAASFSVAAKLFVCALCSSPWGVQWVEFEGCVVLLPLTENLSSTNSLDVIRDVLRLLAAEAGEVLYRSGILNLLAGILAQSEILSLVEFAWDVLAVLPTGSPDLPGWSESRPTHLEAFINRLDPGQVALVSSESRETMSVESEDLDGDLSPASGQHNSMSRRAPLRRCQTERDLGRYASEIRYSISSSSGDSELQMMEVEHLSAASPTSNTVQVTRRYGESHRDIFSHILSLNNPVLFKSAQGYLVKANQSDPQLFQSVPLWLRAQKAIRHYQFSAGVRRFIHSLFENVFVEPEALPYLDRLK